jgi:hypothetical protein
MSLGHAGAEHDRASVGFEDDLAPIAGAPCCAS